MPFVQIVILPGRTQEKKEELIKGMTNVIAETLGIERDQRGRVRIVIFEVPPENIGFWGTPLSEILKGGGTNE